MNRFDVLRAVAFVTTLGFAVVAACWLSGTHPCLRPTPPTSVPQRMPPPACSCERCECCPACRGND